MVLNVPAALRSALLPPRGAYSCLFLQSAKHFRLLKTLICAIHLHHIKRTHTVATLIATQMPVLVVYLPTIFRQLTPQMYGIP